MALSLPLFAILALVAYAVVGVFRRLYLSPISHIPGPKLAAATSAYSFYYDVILKGRYLFKLRELHKQYGPVIRISPEEVHVIDPAFMDVLYTTNNHKRDKWSFFTEVFGVPGASLNTNPHDLHRIRRSALSPFFSKAAIRNLQPLIDAKVDLLLERFEDFKQSGEVLIVDHATAAFTNDVISTVSFGKSHDRLGHPKFDPSFHDGAKNGAETLPFLAHFPIIVRVIEALPEKLMSMLSPEYARFVEEKVEIQQEATKAMQSREEGQYRTIFHEILDSKLPASEKTMARLGDEAAVTLAAGTLTTSWVMSLAIYFLLATPSILEKLKSELEASILNPSDDEPTPLATIEALPYLRACIQEALRMGNGVPGRIAHIAPDENLVVKGASQSWTIPAGTPTSMTVYLMHYDENVFPDPKSFRPERWIENPQLSKSLFAFSRGTRSCVGMNLAYTELSMALAKIFRNYGSVGCRHVGDRGVLELFETEYRDIDLVGTLVLPKVWEGSKGVRVRVLA